MAETSVLWLRVAAGLYSVGLLYALVMTIRKRQHFFRAALVSFGLGGLFHLVSIVEQGIFRRHFPANNIFETMSLCGFIITVLFLLVCWKYHAESLGVFIFPLVFVMTLVAALSNPVSPWSSPILRNTWLTVHIVAIMLGYATLLFTAVASVLYLLLERQIKQKNLKGLARRLPPLGTLDELVARSLTLGFAFITAGIVVGSVWAFVELGMGWIADPRIELSFLTWCIYLAMVFFRTSAGWRGRKAAILAIVASCCSALTWVAHARLQNMAQ